MLFFFFILHSPVSADVLFGLESEQANHSRTTAPKLTHASHKAHATHYCVRSNVLHAGAIHKEKKHQQQQGTIHGLCFSWVSKKDHLLYHHPFRWATRGMSTQREPPPPTPSFSFPPSLSSVFCLSPSISISLPCLPSFVSTALLAHLPAKAVYPPQWSFLFTFASLLPATLPRLHFKATTNGLKQRLTCSSSTTNFFANPPSHFLSPLLQPPFTHAYWSPLKGPFRYLLLAARKGYSRTQQRIYLGFFWLTISLFLKYYSATATKK